MKKRILIFGNGQLGNFYKDYFNSIDISCKLSKADITKPGQIKRAITQFNPTAVINTAARTNLEKVAENKVDAFNVNVLGANNIAEICDAEGIYFIHFSSGCIFESKDETDAKVETDTPAPTAFYSWTKVWSENLVLWNKSKNFKCMILRPRQPVSAHVSYKNMLIKMLTFSKFIDTPNAITVIEDLMEWTNELIDKQFTGVIHVANKGWTTPYRIAKMLKKYINPKLEIEKITKTQLDKITPNKRVDTILDVSLLERQVSSVIPLEQRLGEIIKRLAENIETMNKKSLKKAFDETLVQSKARTVVNNSWKELLK